MPETIKLFDSTNLVGKTRNGENKPIFKIAAIGMMASIIMSIFLKNYAKMAKICFFLKLIL